MPRDLLPPLVAAGGDLLNFASTVMTNASDKKFQKQMYQRQRADALSDWNMQNAYNSPVQQMARLKAAGLNPNLVYGHGADAQSTSAVRPSSMGSYHPQAPQVNATGDLMSYYDTKSKAAMINNLQATNDAIKADIAKKQADTWATVFTNMRNAASASKDKAAAGYYDAQSKKIASMLPLDLTHMQLTIRGQDISQGIQLDQNDRQWIYTQIAQKKLGLQQALVSLALKKEGFVISDIQPAELARIKAQTQEFLNRAGGENLENKLRSQHGVSYHDNVLWRTLGVGVDKIRSAMNKVSPTHF